MKNYSKNLITVLFIFTIGGCATPDRVRFTEIKEQSTSVIINDVRTQEMKIKTTGNNNLGSITILGDDAITPPPKELLKYYISNSKKIANYPTEVELQDFSVKLFEPYVYIDQEALDVANQSMPLIYPITSLLSGVLTEPLIRGIEEMKTKKRIEVYISGLIRGNEFVGLGRKYVKGSISESDIKATIDEALEDSIDEIVELLSNDNASENN